ncbi:hypothetical protein FUSO3_03610 [Fusobacterium necrophorum BL]|uniref:Uncharacterized protein n=1 Tax=Fusobacterium necrophorum BL TaxID=1441732 RepID=A0AB73BXC8_9FUSO|nr:hypothetical protein FUSO3_03610 [Fusobacterium necrophorum BL]
MDLKREFAEVKRERKKNYGIAVSKCNIFILS